MNLSFFTTDHIYRCKLKRNNSNIAANLLSLKKFTHCAVSFFLIGVGCSTQWWQRILGGGTQVCKLYGYVPPKWVVFFTRNPQTWFHFSEQKPQTWVHFSKIFKNRPIFQEKSQEMGTFFGKNDPQKRVRVLRLGWHIPVQIKFKYPPPGSRLTVTRLSL